MIKFKDFEKEIVSVLAGSVLLDEELSRIFAEGECWLDDDHEAGYFINVRHPVIPTVRNVISEPAAQTVVGESCVGFVIFIENHELSIDASPWGEANVPSDFRERVDKVKFGKLENGQFIEQ